MLDFPVPETARALHPTMGQGVAERTYLRRLFTEDQKALLPETLHVNPADPYFKDWIVAAHNTGWQFVDDAEAAMTEAKPETRWETWAEVAQRVALGSVSLLGFRATHAETVQEYTAMSSAIAKGALLMSGRHLQQGDERQRERNMEVFTNCSVTAVSWGLFKLLLNGSGVGRDYSDRMMLIDWAKHMPRIVPVIESTHPDYVWDQHLTPRDALHLYGPADGARVIRHRVKDSREGWAETVELVETITYRNQKGETGITVLILDFSDVRAKGQPIMGMQGRPSSGPVPMMEALTRIDRIGGSGMPAWRATLYIDHFLAEIVLVGGARRAARMSTKYWKDPDALAFIQVKRPVEYHGLTPEEAFLFRQEQAFAPMSFLWSSNNSLTVDQEFWDRLASDDTDPLTLHAKRIHREATAYAYADGTGEPGYINVHLLDQKREGLDHPDYAAGRFMRCLKYTPTAHTEALLADIYTAFLDMPYVCIVNPCGEIAINLLGGFCVIADIVPYHCDTLEEVRETARIAVRALIRVNTMDSLYNREVQRTNRIGVGMTGVHEFAWKFFRCGFRDLIAPDFRTYSQIEWSLVHDTDILGEDAPVRAAAFWAFLGSVARAVDAEGTGYSALFGLPAPFTCMTVKPSGTVSKLFGLTEGWHLPAMAYYLRWVQLHEDSPMIAEYRDKNYPTRELKSYRNHWIVGFPTEPEICTTGIGDKLVTAAEATMEEQFTWLRLGEFFLIEGLSVGMYLSHEGDTRAAMRTRGFQIGNQISYTMKYFEDRVSMTQLADVIEANQPSVRCNSIMPVTNGASYEYLPEEQIDRLEYDALVALIKSRDTTSEDIGAEHLGCGTGGCPIDFKDGDKAVL